MGAIVTHSPAEVIRQYLLDQLVGSAPPSTPWPCYVASMPTEGNEAIAVYDATGGRVQGRHQRGGKTVETRNITIRVRAEDYKTGRSKADSICTLFDLVLRAAVTIDAVPYLINAVSRVSSIKHLGPSDALRQLNLFSVDFLATVSDS